MNTLKRLQLGAVVACAALVPATSFAGQIATIRSITAGDIVTIVGRHNSAGFSSGRGSVFSVSPGQQGLVAELAQGATSASILSVVGLNSAGSPLGNCITTVTGPVPKDPKLVFCTSAVLYRTALTFAE